MSLLSPHKWKRIPEGESPRLRPSLLSKTRVSGGGLLENKKCLRERIRSEDGPVVRVEDMTCYLVVSVEYRG
jgi:hypothetical protein